MKRNLFQLICILLICLTATVSLTHADNKINSVTVETNSSGFVNLTDVVSGRSLIYQKITR